MANETDPVEALRAVQRERLALAIVARSGDPIERAGALARHIEAVNAEAHALSVERGRAVREALALMPAPEVARRLGISRQAVYRAARVPGDTPAAP